MYYNEIGVSKNWNESNFLWNCWGILELESIFKKQLGKYYLCMRIVINYCILHQIIYKVILKITGIHMSPHGYSLKRTKIFFRSRVSSYHSAPAKFRIICLNFTKVNYWVLLHTWLGERYREAWNEKKEF